MRVSEVLDTGGSGENRKGELDRFEFLQNM